MLQLLILSPEIKVVLGKLSPDLITYLYYFSISVMTIWPKFILDIYMEILMLLWYPNDAIIRRDYCMYRSGGFGGIPDFYCTLISMMHICL